MSRVADENNGTDRWASSTIRTTRQRRAVLRLLERTDGFRSAGQIHAQLRAAGSGISLTTVYRALQALAEAGNVDVVRTTGEATYRRCHSSGPHHHLICRQCGRAVEVAAAPVEKWVADTAREHGFSEVSNRVDVFGVCVVCPRAASDHLT
ncbi:transcriptional repressor [Pseudonocardia sp. CNS-139]|nr:transcriptional repressor [Pseudonocardia sp. CNS-139]